MRLAPTGRVQSESDLDDGSEPTDDEDEDESNDEDESLFSYEQWMNNG